MLTKFDDFPLHQTSAPLAYLATSERNAYGRYWFNGFDPEGEFYFGIAFGVYPHREVMDCALSIVRKDGTQDTFRASRHLTGDRTDMRVGPLTLAIEDPMRRLRITILPNDTGITADLIFHARGPVHEEPMDIMRQGVRTVMEVSRYTQFGMWEGFISVGDRRQDIDPAQIYGTRDRSWGWRWIGEREAGISQAMPQQLFWLWAPIHWPQKCTHFGVMESAQGIPSKKFTQVFPAWPISSDFDPLDSSGISPGQDAQHRLKFHAGSRLADTSEIDLTIDGRVKTLVCEPLLTFPMMAIGYFHDDWGHGFYKGELAINAEHTRIDDLPPLSPLRQHVQQVIRVTCDGEVGHGVLEQLIVGPHERYGLQGFLDPAPQQGSVAVRPPSRDVT
ncbi:hypothetical protein Sphch_0155 [Sphingobium chlorophenolicum L-1]|uniref:Hydroxyneurosporene synthase n=1 Tax=Sphingobium chlorophenolicum L-1 TaxID=690566 RepID=F6EUG2_SPHCR|nr:hypothetical protein [Sphingobium chlorophenolicum]AEG47856.1 hypothetical protein Sphch_0155 [Sphingobium chlorophenolicum L-1]